MRKLDSSAFAGFVTRGRMVGFVDASVLAEETGGTPGAALVRRSHPGNMDCVADCAMAGEGPRL
jgi:hypothetical protein